MIISKTEKSIGLRYTEKSQIKLQADQYGLSITVSDPDGHVVYYPLTPSDTEIVHQFLGEVLPMWDKDEI